MPRRRIQQAPVTTGPRLRTPVKISTQSGYRRWRLRRVAAIAVISIGILMALSHIIEHLGRVHLLPGVVQDLVLGYPMAGAFVVAGLFLYPK